MLLLYEVTVTFFPSKEFEWEIDQLSFNADLARKLNLQWSSTPKIETSYIGRNREDGDSEDENGQTHEQWEERSDE